MSVGRPAGGRGRRARRRWCPTRTDGRVVPGRPSGAAPGPGRRARGAIGLAQGVGVAGGHHQGGVAHHLGQRAGRGGHHGGAGGHGLERGQAEPLVHRRVGVDAGPAQQGGPLVVVDPARAGGSAPGAGWRRRRSARASAPQPSGPAITRSEVGMVGGQRVEGGAPATAGPCGARPCRAASTYGCPPASRRPVAASVPGRSAGGGVDPVGDHHHPRRARRRTPRRSPRPRSAEPVWIVAPRARARRISAGIGQRVGGAQLGEPDEREVVDRHDLGGVAGGGNHVVGAVHDVDRSGPPLDGRVVEAAPGLPEGPGGHRPADRDHARRHRRGQLVRGPAR